LTQSMDMTGHGWRCLDCTLRADIRVLEDNDSAIREHLTKEESKAVLPKKVSESQVRKMVRGTAVVFIALSMMGIAFQ